MLDIVVGLLNAGVALGTLLTAWFWLKSARIRVRDSQDDFIEDLQAIGKQSGWSYSRVLLPFVSSRSGLGQSAYFEGRSK